MRIIQNTPELLILQDRTIIVAMVFGAVALLLVIMAWFARVNAVGISLGLLLIASILLLGVTFSYRDTRIEFSRVARSVTIDQRNLIRRSSDTVLLNQIRQAVAQHGGYKTRKGNSVVVHGRRPALELNRKGPAIVLSRGYGDAEPIEAAVRTINEWLAEERAARR